MESETHKAEIEIATRELVKRISHLPLVDGVADALAAKLMEMACKVPSGHAESTVARRAADVGAMGIAVAGDVGTCYCVACFAKLRLALSLASGTLMSISMAAGEGEVGHSHGELALQAILATKEFTAWWHAEMEKVVQRDLLASAEGGPVH